MKTVIGLAGVKTSGKSTVAYMMHEFINAKEVALADKLKNVCANIFNLDRKQFDVQELKEVPFNTPRELTIEVIKKCLEGFNITLSEELLEKYTKSGIINMQLETPRKIVQIIGTEVLRMAGDEDIHCKNAMLSPEGITIVTDLRFPNEFDYFNNSEDINFIPIHVQRDEAENLVTKDSHPSETSVFKFTDKCIKINNNGSFLDTELQVRNILNEHIHNKEN